MKLDPISNAGCINSDIQETLSSFAPFARDAYMTLNDLSYFKSKLLPSSEAVEVPRSSWRKTKIVWSSHVADLKSFRVLAVAVAALLCVSTYFAVAKSNGLVARSIFSGRQLSSYFMRPASVNLPQLPYVLSVAAAIFASQTEIYVLTSDVRHYFHGIALGADIQSFFTIFVGCTLYRFLVLPMGWSFSPRVAQCFAWAALLSLASESNGLKEAAEGLKNSAHPPSHVILQAGDRRIGIVFIWYDNFICLCGNKEMALEFSNTLTRMTSLFNFHWGEKAMSHPCHLRRLAASTMSTVHRLTAELKEDPSNTQLEKELRFYKKEATAVGIQFGMSKRRSRDSRLNTLLQWRIKPSTAEKAATLLETLELSNAMSCRSIAAVCGICVWRSYIAGEPLVRIHDIISLSSKAGKQACKSGWSSNLPIDGLEKAQMVSALKEFLRNEWHTISASDASGDLLILATDATPLLGGWTIVGSATIRVDWDNWYWIPPREGEEPTPSAEIIFLLELRAAETAILKHARRGVLIVLLIDNTAAAACLRRWYSGHPEGRNIVSNIWNHLQSTGCRLLVVGVVSDDNDADSPTRGVKSHPAFSSERLRRSYEAATRALDGCERQALNANIMPGSHFEEAFTDDSMPESHDSNESDEGDEFCMTISDHLLCLVQQTTFERK